MVDFESGAMLNSNNFIIKRHIDIQAFFPQICLQIKKMLNTRFSIRDRQLNGCVDENMILHLC